MRTKHSDDYLTFPEFRIFLQYLRMYFELFQAFARLDTGDDRRMDIDEFKAGIDNLADWGISVDDPEAEFAAIDKSGGGQVLFGEFCEWAIPRGLDLEDDGDDDE